MTSINSLRPERSRSWRMLAALVVLLASQLLLVGRAAAQGTMGAVPDPITSRELDEYARRLGLSAQQRGALEQYHEAYRAQFAILRDGEIEKYLTEANGGGGRGMGGRGAGMGMLFGNTDRKAIEASLRQLQTINDRIKALDNSLFDQIQTLLTEDQIIALTSVRQSRERERYRTGLSRMATFSNPSTQVDLSDIVVDFTLSPDEKANTAPLLAGYESSLTVATRKLHDDAESSTVSMLEKLEKMGFTAESMQDNRQRGQMFEAFRTVWGEIMTTMNERASDISDLNRKTERSLAAVLSADNARRLRDSFFRRAYPELRASSNTARAFETALKFEDLTEDQRNAITAMRQQYLDSVDQLNEQMADLIDTQRKARTGLDFGGPGGGQGGRGGGGRGGQGNNGGDNSQDEELRKLREQRQQLVEGMRSQMESTLGPEKTEQLQKLVAQARDRGRDVAVANTMTFVAAAPAGGGAFTSTTPIVISGDINVADLAVEINGPSRDPFVPAAISDRDVDGYAKRLGLSEDDRTILSGLHAEYADRFAQINDTDIQAVRDADDALWQRNEGGRPTPPTPEAVDHLYTLRRQAIAAIKTLDEQFFNDVQVALLTDAQQPLLDRVRQSRLRAIYNRGSNGQGVFNINGGGGRGGRGGPGGGQRMVFTTMGGGSGESTVDLSMLVEQSKITPADPAQLDGSLAEYEAAATATFQIMFETGMRLRQATDRMAGQFNRGGDRGGNGGGNAVNIDGDAIRQAMETDGKAARDAAAAMTTLNRETLDRLLASLDAVNADILRRDYNRKAFPDIYRDPRSAEPRIEAALALPDLSDQQRGILQAMAIEFHTTYDALCDQMVELERSAPATNFGGGGGGGGGGGRGGQGGGAGGGGGPNIDFQALQERMRAREKLDFERTDLSDKMLARLRSSLSEEQIARLGLDANAGSF